MAYNHKKTEEKWRKYWEENKTFRTDVWDFSKPKFYALDMFPYPSGAGLHVGHPEGYTATDIVSRKKRMEGYNVLHPSVFLQNSMRSIREIIPMSSQRTISASLPIS